MVAVIDSGDISELLEYRRLIQGRRGSYSVAWRKELWQGAKYHLAVLLDDENKVRWLGRARGRRRVSDRERRIEVTEIEEFDGPPFEDLRNRLPERHKQGLKVGVLSEAVGSATIQALLSMQPQQAVLIDRLSRQDQFPVLRGQRGLALNEQRDGTGLLLDMAGIGREALSAWELTEEQPSFLAGLERRPVSEETLINHDVSRFPDLIAAESGYVDWHVFSGSRRQLFVLNANMEPLEATLGVDVVYFNETFGSFVLVQYKRMKRENESRGGSRLWYRPDSNLWIELDRMRRVDELYGSGSGDFRLFGQPCWMKLCDPGARVDDPTELVKGLYLAREYFVELLDTCIGPRGGVRLGYDNIPRHINNTMFAQLVKDGWIGTRGSGTTDLEAIVRDVLLSRRALVLGVALAVAGD